VSFFPLLVAGPIERATHLLPQLKKARKFDYANTVDALRQILWGLVKKVVIADGCATFANEIFESSSDYSGSTLVLGALFFSFQIYGDFSGYSDIAIGAANVMGFDLMTNFKRPYLSKTIAEFWQRWHISLSTWFRDYVYISLGGSRVSIPRWYFNVMLIFLISGLWHGANWTYIIWGGLNGFYLVFAMATEKWRHRLNHLLLMHHLPKIHSFIQICLTFLLICFSLVFFRSDSLHTAMTILKKMTSFKGGLFIGDKDFMVYSIMAILILIFVEVKGEYFSDKIALLHNKNIVVRFIVYTILMLYMGLFGAFFGGQFFYFQF
jgi:D-alanyl-lipoteichoic acid acyltransferase DltB (MBOAT superfamily)